MTTTATPTPTAVAGQYPGPTLVAPVPALVTRGAISIRNVTKIYDPDGAAITAVDDCSMEIAGGEVCMIVGPSGCGKTTLLNAVAGFHSITFGEVLLDDEVLCSAEKPLAGQSSDRIVVFQNGALFPWKTLARTSRSARWCSGA